MTINYIKFEMWLQLEFLLFAANLFGYVIWLLIRSFTKDVEVDIFSNNSISEVEKLDSIQT